MSNNKYQFKGTQGPWEHFFNTPDKVPVQHVPQGEDANPFQSKYIYVGGDKITCTVNSMSTGNFADIEHFEANAYLIAAAPDLLVACINMVEMLHDSDPRTGEMRIAIHKALNIEAEEA